MTLHIQGPFTHEVKLVQLLGDDVETLPQGFEAATQEQERQAPIKGSAWQPS